jgi:hypothetical protein
MRVVSNFLSTLIQRRANLLQDREKKNVMNLYFEFQILIFFNCYEFPS